MTKSCKVGIHNCGINVVVTQKQSTHPVPNDPKPLQGEELYNAIFGQDLSALKCPFGDPDESPSHSDDAGADSCNSSTTAHRLATSESSENQSDAGDTLSEKNLIRSTQRYVGLVPVALDVFA